MTEGEWLTTTEAWKMRDELESPRRVLQFKAGRRKARLMACAWCRPLVPHVPGEWAAAVIELVERFADGEIGKSDLRQAAEVAREGAARVARGGQRSASRLGAEAIIWATHAVSVLPLHSAPVMLGNLHMMLDQVARLTPLARDRCEVVREVFGNPFRPVKLAPARVRANDGAARRLAETIYTHRAFGDAPVLADALEDAGCEEEALLGHLRSPGPHVRGCWAVDVVLGRG